MNSVCRIALTVVLISVLAQAGAATVTLVDRGEAKCSIVLPTAVRPHNVAKYGPPRGEIPPKKSAELLAECLKKISGAEITISDQPVRGLLPIYVGAGVHSNAFARPAPSEFGDSYFVDAQKGHIRLFGETDRAVFYAASHLLHELGVRWYAPGEMGEVVPQMKTVRLEIGMRQESPDFQTRNVWGRSPEVIEWLLRNRMGGPMIAQGHAFGGFMQGITLEEHPDYFPIIDGKPARRQINLSSPAVVQLFADKLAEQFRKGPTSWAGGKSAGIGPDDGFLQDERPETVAMNSGEIDPLLRISSFTDAFVKFVNAVCEKLEGEFPDHTLGFYVYSNHKMPPKTVKPHRMIVPVVAPITYNRYTSIGNPNEPTSMLLEHVIKEWKKVCPRLGCYLYNFNLADTAMPFTRRLAWTKDIPHLYELGLRYCTMETMDNWHAMVPGNYVIGRLLWDTKADVDAILDEVYPAYYGPAAKAMLEYNTVLEIAYESTDAYAGNLWSMHRILNPDVMKRMEAALSQAERRAKDDPLISRRIEPIRYSLNAAVHWLSARDAINGFRLEEAEKHSAAFLANYEEADKKYPVYFAATNASYFKIFHHRSLTDAGRVAREGEIIYKFPDELTAFLDQDLLGEQMGLHHPDAKTGNWLTLRTYSASLDEQGFPFYRGLIWYRHTFELPRSARDSEVLKLWCGGIDGTVRVWLNGQDLGKHNVSNFGPLDVDITKSVSRDDTNTIAIAVDNTFVNELGTGGIMRPMLIYMKK